MPSKAPSRRAVDFPNASTPKAHAARRDGPSPYDWRWQQARARFLKAYPVCVNTGLLADTVDHIIPHRGDATLFWDTDNWQPLTRGAHGEKTAWENAFFPERNLFIPQDIPRPTCPAILLCGPPGAGKTTWANQQANATVIDLDAIALDALGRPYCTRDELPDMLRRRNEMLKKTYPPSTKLIVIATAANTHMRAQLQYLLRAQCIVMDTPAFACVERIRRDNERLPIQDERIAAVHRWHDTYRQRTLDGPIPEREGR